MPSRNLVVTIALRFVIFALDSVQMSNVQRARVVTREAVERESDRRRMK